jgi:hypothetical protein
MWVVWMGVVREELLVRGDRGSGRLTVLFDSGSSRSLIRSNVAVELCTPKKLLVPRVFMVADGGRVACDLLCDLVVEIGGKEVGVEGFLVDRLPAVIFGALDMVAYRIKLDLARRTLDLSEFTGSMLAV